MDNNYAMCFQVRPPYESFGLGGGGPFHGVYHKRIAGFPSGPKRSTHRKPASAGSAFIVKNLLGVAPLCLP